MFHLHVHGISLGKYFVQQFLGFETLFVIIIISFYSINGWLVAVIVLQDLVIPRNRLFKPGWNIDILQAYGWHKMQYFFFFFYEKVWNINYFHQLYSNTYFIILLFKTLGTPKWIVILRYISRKVESNDLRNSLREPFHKVDIKFMKVIPPSCTNLQLSEVNVCVHKSILRWYWSVCYREW